MTRIDFYVLPGSDTQARLDLVCRLAEKASGRRQRVFVYSEDDTLLEQLDDCLWQFRPLSFVPHCRISPVTATVSDSDEPVQLSSAPPAYDRQVLINLSESVPAFFSRFERTLEVVDNTPEIRSSGRERYRFYQQRGYPLQHHKI